MRSTWGAISQHLMHACVWSTWGPLPCSVYPYACGAPVALPCRVCTRVSSTCSRLSTCRVDGSLAMPRRACAARARTFSSALAAGACWPAGAGRAAGMLRGTGCGTRVCCGNKPLLCIVLGMHCVRMHQVRGISCLGATSCWALPALCWALQAREQQNGFLPERHIVPRKLQAWQVCNALGAWHWDEVVLECA